ncbi:uncharacterized protein DS421_7g220240 [Arachis hypogaea]|nr:uncharacterized protein DS421_7g220240 [Arachis hypogaea]
MCRSLCRLPSLPPSYRAAMPPPPSGCCAAIETVQRGRKRYDEEGSRSPSRSLQARRPCLVAVLESSPPMLSTTAAAFERSRHLSWEERSRGEEILLMLWQRRRTRRVRESDAQRRDHSSIAAGRCHH